MPYSHRTPYVLMHMLLLLPCHPHSAHHSLPALRQFSMMPLFVIGFGDTLDELGANSESATLASETPSVVDAVSEIVIRFAVIGAVTLFSGFTYVSVWSIAGERQVRYN